MAVRVNFECEATRKGHTGVVRAVAATACGRVVSAGDDKHVKVWAARQGGAVHSFEGHALPVVSVAALSNGRAASGSFDRAIKLWNVTGQGQPAQAQPPLATMGGQGGHMLPVECLAALPNERLVTGSIDGTAKLWDLSDSRCLRTFQGHGSSVEAVAPVAGERLVTGSVDRTVKLWDLADGRCLQTFSGHGGSVWCVAVVSGDRVASGSGDNTIKIWLLSAPAGAAPAATLTGHSGAVNGIAYLPVGLVLSGSADGGLRIWNLDDGSCVQTLTGASGGPIFSVAVLPDGRLCSSDNDGTIKIYVDRQRQVEKGLAKSMTRQRLLPELHERMANFL